MVNAEGRVRGKAIVRLGSGGMGSFLSSRPTQVSRPIPRCHVACNSFDWRFNFVLTFFLGLFLYFLWAQEVGFACGFAIRRNLVD